MMKSIAALALAVAVLVGCASTKGTGQVTLDASSPEAAEASYKAMMSSRSGAERQQLAVAMLKLNMEGVRSAHDVVADPELQSLSIARVRGKVAGMTAEQIIERANKGPTGGVEAKDQ